jgi:hypothetical protein
LRNPIASLIDFVGLNGNGAWPAAVLGCFFRVGLRRSAGEAIIRTALVLMAVVAVAPQVARAHVVRHNSVPEAYWGTWSPGAACSADDKSAIVLAAKTYVGPAGNCSVDYVSETATPKGSTYSARLLCPGTGARKKTVANLIFRSDADGGISAGPTFESLKAHRRCSTSDPAAKK